MTAECELCRREFPVEFLVAAHIKRRALCNDAERRDLANVAMLACELGCDRLFEDGCVTVSAAGLVIVAPTAGTTTALAQYLNRLDGERCGAFRPDTARYFAWHRENIFRGDAAATTAGRT